MKISVHIIPRASRSKIEQIADNEFKVWVTAVPEKDKANEAMIKLLAKHLKVAKSRLQITAGHKSKNKIVEII
ncbi:MAG: hypothetical protein A2233_00605 [Candidatus Kerfeldbacteria bacterium RIFOXYA2_FULL_38_24]|uniref:UPF0235 protein A2319_02895 n=1 Tax=Candidatus Kerfeldbacteria bacterium RIFOXYB2_FULL_38_14 TaxID=1798547 RepID=A0A1G2BEI3_9BACT|nr:MAG: hypothetical protein A2233_00605 [Candidatus Kerfeldbacteria bacterium RIFOXYA2_FULL_38_24]OGY86660.1 MAG: hypothetical protein A2319_02895 [Candidatus Kerfeldbacteria bacterium RIFOXYB2_FULL_38_14]OGY88546.1 MAG: hypothetical protein A2458_05345 [Candidatus Kerfeldbacteria bacterium RIFOXYC2_FULL_38_9]